MSLLLSASRWYRTRCSGRLVSKKGAKSLAELGAWLGSVSPCLLLVSRWGWQEVGVLGTAAVVGERRRVVSREGLENVGVVGWERDWAAEAAWLPLVNIEEAEGDLTRDMWWLVLWLALLVPRAV